MTVAGFGSPSCSSCGWAADGSARHHDDCPQRVAAGTSRRDLLALVARVFRGPDVRAFLGANGAGFVRVDDGALDELRALLDREVPK